MKSTPAAEIINRIGRRAHILGWICTLWPISFVLYNEFWREGWSGFSTLEMVAYGLPVFALPVLGYLVRGLYRRQDDLEAARSYLRNVIDHMGDLLVIIDRHRRIVFTNPRVEHYFGPILGRSCGETLREGESVCSTCPIDHPESGRRSICRRRRKVRGGKLRWFEISASPFRDVDGEPTGVIEIWRDITAKVGLEQKLKAQARTDSLTKLGNSRSFFQALPREMQRARRQNYPLALLILDVDRFKQFNDHYGHLAGDHLLQSLGRIIRAQIRTHVDYGFRYGGDEFAVILAYSGREQAENISRRIVEAFRAEDFPLVTLSIGIRLVEDELNANRLVDAADKAMYEAKRAGGDLVHFHGSLPPA